jgi:hypothetical protein
MAQIINVQTGFRATDAPDDWKTNGQYDNNVWKLDNSVPVRPVTTGAGSTTDFEAGKGIAGYDQALVNNKNSGASIGTTESAANKAARDYYNALPRTGPTEADQDAIRESIRKQMQSQIDAINNSYDSIVASARTEGEDRLGQTRALSSRSGMLGAPMGEAQKAKTTEYNGKVVNAIEAERGTKIAAIWADIDKRTTDKIEKQKTEALTNAKDYIDYLKTAEDSAKTDMVNLAKSGVDLSTLSEDDYKTLLEQTGYNPLVFKSLWNSNLPSQQKRDYNYVNLGNGKVAVFSVNPATNQMEKEEYDMSIETGQEIKEFDGVPYISTKDADGNIILKNVQGYDYDTVNKKNLMELRGGLYNIQTNKWVVGPKADSGGSSEKLTTDEMKMIANQKVAPQLDGVKGADGFVSPTDYRKARNAYVASGLNAGDFDNSFSIYANPNMVEAYDFVGKKLKATE